MCNVCHGCDTTMSCKDPLEDQTHAHRELQASHTGLCMEYGTYGTSTLSLCDDHSRELIPFIPSRFQNVY